MDVAQFYQATVGDRDSGFAVQILAVSSRYVSLDKNLPGLSDRLGLRTVFMMEGGEESLESAIEAILVARTPSEARRFLLGLDGYPGRITDQVALREWRYEARTFARHVATADIIPLETSALDVRSLLEILRHTAVQRPDIPVGAAVGLVAAGYSPLVLLTVPLGIILVGAAIDSNKPGRRGLVQRLRSFIGLQPRPLEPVGDATRESPRRRLRKRGRSDPKELGS